MDSTIDDRLSHETLAIQQHAGSQITHLEQTIMQDPNGNDTNTICLTLKQELVDKATGTENSGDNETVSPAMERICHISNVSSGETVETTTPESASTAMLLTGSRPGELPIIVPSGKTIFLSDQFTAVLIRPESLLYGMEVPVPVIKKEAPEGASGDSGDGAGGNAAPAIEHVVTVSSESPQSQTVTVTDSSVQVPWFLQVGQGLDQGQVEQEQQTSSPDDSDSKGVGVDPISIEPIATAPDAASATPKTPYMFTSKDRLFTCEFCPNITFTRGQLRKHKTVHTGQRNYICGVCNKRFAVKHSLLKHMVLHSGTSPFTCEQCGKGFSTAYHLQHHSKAHDPERQFKCSQCDKMFAKPDHLMVHARTHTGEETFPCGECGKSFTTKFGLNTHMRVHTGASAVYCCGLCGVQLASYCELVSHAKSHGEQEQTALGAASECVLIIDESDRTRSQVVPATVVTSTAMPMPVGTNVNGVSTP